MKSGTPSHKSHHPGLKVCGLTKIEQIRELILMEADFLGFIFYKKSPRYALNRLTMNEISTIRHHAKVGVFVNESPECIAETADAAQLDLIQLHGDEDENFMAVLRQMLYPDTGIIKVIRIADQTPDEIQDLMNRTRSAARYFLFDTDSKAFGGTGKMFDWHLLNRLEIPLPYFLSGGISEENAGETGMLKQKPFALDINSKFETEPGIKDTEKIRIFKNKIKK